MMMESVRERRRAATRREILSVAWELAGERGIAGVSLREVASRVGMRAPSLYTYFESKDAIFDAMFAEGYHALIDFYDELGAATGGMNPIDTLTLGIEGFMDFCQAVPARYQLMFGRPVPGWEPSPEAYEVSVASYRYSARFFESLDVDEQSLLDLCLATIAGLAAQQVANEPGGKRWRRLSRETAEMLLGHIEAAKER
jgi:AcrR family transcriptional regulator